MFLILEAPRILGRISPYLKTIPNKPGKLAQCIPIYGTILGQCTRNRANAGPIFLVCRVISQNKEKIIFLTKTVSYSP